MRCDLFGIESRDDLEMLSNAAGFSSTHTTPKLVRRSKNPR
jgi:hypothetical protein